MKLYKILMTILGIALANNIVASNQQQKPQPKDIAFDDMHKNADIHCQCTGCDDLTKLVAKDRNSVLPLCSKLMVLEEYFLDGKNVSGLDFFRQRARKKRFLYGSK